MIKFRKNLVTGFTLMEILVALAVFAVIALLMATSFLRLSNVRKSVEAKQIVLNDLRYALDTMGQEIIGGTGFPDNCSGGCSVMQFSVNTRPELGDRLIRYRVDNGRLLKAQQKSYGPCANASTFLTDPACEEQLTSRIVFVDKLEFFIENADNEDLEPIVTTAIKGKISPGSPQEEPFQFSMSQTPRLFTTVSGTTSLIQQLQRTSRICITGPASGMNSQSGLPTGNACQNTSPGVSTPFVTTSSSIQLSGFSEDSTGSIATCFSERGGKGYYGCRFRNPESWITTIDLTQGGGLYSLVAFANHDNSLQDHVNILYIAPPKFITPPSITCSYDEVGTPTLFMYLPDIPYIDGINAPWKIVLERCKGTGCTDFTTISEWIRDGSNQPIRYDDSGLEPNTSYSYRFFAKAQPPSNAISSFSDIGTRTTDAGSKCYVPPPQPPAGEFTLAVDGDLAVSVNGKGGNAESDNVTITVSPGSNFTGEVTFNESDVEVLNNPGIPGLNPKITPNRLTPSGGSGSRRYTEGVRFSVKVPNSTPVLTGNPDYYTLRVTARSGNSAQSILVHLYVSPQSTRQD
jgi:prepilin-type N-terminal cleavage/methylation domain-containing protein